MCSFQPEGDIIERRPLRRKRKIEHLSSAARVVMGLRHMLAGAGAEGKSAERRQPTPTIAVVADDS